MERSSLRVSSHWLGNNFAFGPLCWLMDGGGPLARSEETAPVDFAFTRHVISALAAPNRGRWVISQAPDGGCHGPNRLPWADYPTELPLLGIRGLVDYRKASGSRVGEPAMEELCELHPDRRPQTVVREDPGGFPGMAGEIQAVSLPMAAHIRVAQPDSSPAMRQARKLTIAVAVVSTYPVTSALGASPVAEGQAGWRGVALILEPRTCRRPVAHRPRLGVRDRPAAHTRTRRLADGPHRQ
jgi:hypothetical protein